MDLEYDAPAEDSTRGEITRILALLTDTTLRERRQAVTRAIRQINDIHVVGHLLRELGILIRAWYSLHMNEQVPDATQTPSTDIMYHYLHAHQVAVVRLLMLNDQRETNAFDRLDQDSTTNTAILNRIRNPGGN